MTLISEFRVFCDQHRTGNCKSQLGQDLWVLWHEARDAGGSGIFSRTSFFVEVGAGDGVTDSNTYLLEKEYGWTGILSEPNRQLYQRAVESRTGRVMSFALAGDCSRRRFSSTDIPYLSTLSGYGQDHLAEARREVDAYDVECLTLDVLLREGHAPQKIDYLSLDLEGAEFDVLSSFSFRYDIRYMTVEHNGAQRDKTHSLLRSHGYERFDAPEITQWDDWYVKI